MLLFVQLLSGMERRPALLVILGVLTAESQMTGLVMWVAVGHGC